MATEQPTPLKGLALLGIGEDFPALTALQGMVSPAHLREAASPYRQTVSPPNDSDSAQCVVEEAAEKTGKDSHDAEQMAVATNAEQSPSPARSAQRSVPKATSLFDIPGAGDPFRDASGVPVRDEELRLLFDTYDQDGSGFINKTEFLKEYRQMESFGLEMTDREINQLFAKYDGIGSGRSDDKLSFDEFALLMLHRSKL